MRGIEVRPHLLTGCGKALALPDPDKKPIVAVTGMVVPSFGHARVTRAIKKVPE